MAKYTSDTNLIRGAAAVGQSMMPTDLSGLDKITKAGTDMMDKASKDVEAEIKERDELKKKFDDSSEAVLLRSGALGGKLYDATVEKVKKLRLSYIDGIVNKDEKQKMNAIVALNNHSIFIQDHKQTNVNIADLRTKGKLSSYYEENDEGKRKMKIMTQIQDQAYVDVTTDETTGEEVFHVKVEDEIIKVSNKEYKKMASTLRNYTTGNKYINTLNAAKKDETFSDDMFRQNVKQSLPTTNDEWDAVAYDDISGTNLKKMLNDSGTLDQEILNAIDPKVWNLDDDPKTLNKEEKAAFIDAVVNTENYFFKLDVSNQILEDQLTNAGRESHRLHWEKINKDKQEILNKQINANKRNTLPVNYGGGYITTKSAETLVSDIEDKVKNVFPPNGGSYRFNEQTNTYEKLTRDEKTKKIIATPVSNQSILAGAGIWQQGYRLDEYGYTQQNNEGGGGGGGRETASVAQILQHGGDEAKMYNMNTMVGDKTFSELFDGSIDDDIVAKKLKAAFPNLEVTAPFNVKEKIRINTREFNVKNKSDMAKLLEYLNSPKIQKSISPEANTEFNSTTP